MAFKNSLKIYLEKGFFPFAGRRLASGPPAEAGPAKPPRAPRLAWPSPAPRRAWPASTRLPAPRRAPDRVRDCPPRGATRRRWPDSASTRRGSPGIAGHGLSSHRARLASHFLLLPSPLARTAPATHPPPAATSSLAGFSSSVHHSSPATTPSHLKLRLHPAHPVLALLRRGKHPVLGNCSPEHGRARW